MSKESQPDLKQVAARTTRANTEARRTRDITKALLVAALRRQRLDLVADQIALRDMSLAELNRIASHL